MDVPADNTRHTAARAEKSVKPLLGWLIYRRISLPISLRLARTRVMPNHVTAAALTLGLFGAAALAVGSYRWGLLGALLANMGMVADAIDGELARAKGVASKSGYVLDNFCDRVRDTAVIAGCGIGAARADVTGAYAWTVAAVGLYLLYFYLSSISPAHWREAHSDADLDTKHLVHWTRVRIGIGDSLAAAVAVAAALGRPILIAQAAVIAVPFVAWMKVRHLQRLRPWDPS